jgi:hypothetical protein
MILVLLVVGSEATERLINIMPRRLQNPMRRLLRVASPMALGTTFGEK